MTRDYIAAEQYTTKRLKEVGGSMTVADYVNSEELDCAFLAGVKHERKRSQILVEALRQIAGVRPVLHTNKNVDAFIAQVLKEYGTQDDVVDSAASKRDGE